MSAKELVLVFGPTAVGKTDFAITLAQEYGSPVISCDSRQIYRELRIGTAPPDDAQLAQVRHYFIFSHSVTEYYTAGRYELEAMALLEELFRTHDRLVVCGGSGLYLDALCRGLDDFPEADQALRSALGERLRTEGLPSLQRELAERDPESYATVDLANPQRVIRALEVTLATGRKYSSFKTAPRKERPFSVRKIYLNRNRDELYDRINRRVDRMMEDGLLEEVRGLLPYRHLPALNTVGYRELFAFLDGRCSLDEAVELVKRNTRRYAKRQQTWWRRDEAFMRML